MVFARMSRESLLLTPATHMVKWLVHKAKVLGRVRYFTP